MTNPIRIINTAILLVLIAATAASAATDIKLRERVTTSGSMVRLGDVAEVVDADRSQARQLAALPLIPSPAPGTQRFLRQREIEDFLAASGVDLKTLRIDGARQVTIDAGDVAGRKDEDASISKPRALNRHAAILAGHDSAGSTDAITQAWEEKIINDLRNLITSYLKSSTGENSARCVACDVVERHLVLLDSATSPLTCRGGSPPWTGRQRFVISFTTADGAIEIPVYAEIGAPSAPVVVAVRPIARGEQITAEHVELRTVDHTNTANGRRAAVDSIDKLKGMEARQAIQQGDIILADQVRAPLLVKRGELITVSSQGSGIRVRTTARASKDGAQGDIVQVESLESRDRYDVCVVGPREAAVVAITTPSIAEPSGRIDTARR